VTLKPQCTNEQEDSGGPHSWFVRCGRALGHTGPCKFYLSEKERVAEGTMAHSVLEDAAGIQVVPRFRMEALQTVMEKKRAEVAGYIKELRDAPNGSERQIRRLLSIQSSLDLVLDDLPNAL